MDDKPEKRTLPNRVKIVFLAIDMKLILDIMSSILSGKLHIRII